MVHLQLEGMIGNNLFQYAFARIIAEQLGYALETRHSPYATSKNTPQLLALTEQFADAPLNLPGKSFDSPEDRIAWMQEGGFKGFLVDMEKMVSPQPRKIMLRGYFERYEYYRPHKDRIRRWFSVPPVTLGHDVADQDIVMHLRRGDFVVFGRAISLDFYLGVLEQMDFRRLYICGFGLDEEVRRTFAAYKPIYVQDTPANDFRFIKGFRRIIQSQSTFSWWAGFLSDAEKIYAPLTVPLSTKFEREFPHVDLAVNDENRYHYVNDVAQLERDYLLEDVLASWRHLSMRDRLVGLTRTSLQAGYERLAKMFTGT